MDEETDVTVAAHGAEEVRALLTALGHGDCVPRKTHIHLDDHYRLMGQERVRAERAEAERDEALRRLDEAHLARIEAQNPGIDIERVREQRGEWGEAWGAVLSDDAGPTEPASPEPGTGDTPTA